jgi:murein DD-endopeptidase MepM/ murein hydrolase activator NlpD
MMYKFSQGGFARMALDTAAGEDLFRRISAVSLVLRRDVQEIALYNKELARQRRLRKKLLAQRRAQTRLDKQLDLAVEQTRLAQNKLAWHLRQIRSSRKLQALLSGELNRQQRLLLSRIRNIHARLRRAAGLAPFRGRLPWPVDGGRVVGRFGTSRDKRDRLEVVRHGLTFRAPAGARVRALAPGTVRLAGPLPGYGNVVLVQHSGGYYSVYGFLARMRVEEGTEVYRRTTLGWAGLDPLSGKPAAYLEIRRGTEALDPLRWLAH